MKFKITQRNIILLLVLCIVIAGAVYLGFNQFLNSKEHALKIVFVELTKSDEGVNFTVTTKIQNTGNNDIQHAELNLIFIKDNDIIDTTVQSINLTTNWADTYSTHFINVPFQIGSTYKAIASIYFENECLDTKTITKQF